MHVEVVSVVTVVAELTLLCFEEGFVVLVSVDKGTFIVDRVTVTVMSRVS